MLPEVRRFKAKLVGVSFPNEDGTSRQALIAALAAGDDLVLKREPTNPVDKYAIAVHRKDGSQLGYLPGGDYRLALHLDAGEGARAAVVATVGGSANSDGSAQSLGCVVEIEVDEPPIDWSAVTPLLDLSRKIEKFLAATKKLEKSNPTAAIDRYKRGIRQVVEFDAQGPLARSWRRARYPIARLSLLLEQQGRWDEALEAIEFYQQHGDAIGLPIEEQRSIAARKTRLSKRVAQGDA